MAKRRRPRKPLTLSQRVLILEKHVDGLVTQCQLEIDARLKIVERYMRRRLVTDDADASEPIVVRRRVNFTRAAFRR